MGGENLTRTADFIADNKSRLIALWEERARREVAGAEHPKTEELRDHLEALLDELQNSLRKIDPETSARSASERAFQLQRSQEHGLGRARETNYRVDEVLEDYIILRQVITDQIQDADLSDLRTVEAINRMFELASLGAVKSFTDFVTRNQEKMLATLVHDIRSPLAVAISALNLLGEEQANLRTDSELYGMIDSSLQRSLEMISSLLDNFSEESKSGLTLYFNETDLVQIFKNSVRVLEHVYGENLKYAFPSHPIKGVFAQDILVRVLENLISNAFKHGDAKSPVNVELKELDGETVMFSVHNQGHPIPERQKKEIFKIFTTSHARDLSKSQGWGLGLTHVKLAARAHGGDVDLISDEESGTIFTVTVKKHYQQPGKKRFSISDDE